MMARGGLVGVVAIWATVVASLAPVSSSVSAHPGRLAADGCHNDRKNGGRHCHGNQRRSVPKQNASSGSVYFVNCDAVRAAGAAQVYRDQPGYAPHLDRDDDDVGCE